MSQLTDGLNIATNEDYHGDRKYLSSSVLKTVLKSLNDYKKYYIDGEVKTFNNRDALNEGTLAHAYILEPHLVETDFSFFPGFRKAGKEFEEFLSKMSPEDAKKPVISMPQKVRTKNLIDIYKLHPVAPKLIAGGEAEQTICGTLHGVPIKTRYDYINVDKGYIVDVKTTGYSGEIDSFKQTIKDLNYELSAALYCQIAEQFYGKPFDFYFVVLSKKELQTHVYKMSEETMNRGKRMVLEACNKYKKALDTGIWEESSTAKPLVQDEEILEV
jgi:exodeoxyribonuclease VIII